jgi:hypothetical protein
MDDSGRIAFAGERAGLLGASSIRRHPYSAPNIG